MKTKAIESLGRFCSIDEPFCKCTVLFIDRYCPAESEIGERPHLFRPNDENTGKTV